MRESSYNPTGGNADRVVVEPGAAHEVAALRGPGIIRHIWFTIGGNDAHLYQAIRFECRFDGADPAQVDVPIADFFLFGHGDLVDVDSGPIQVSRQPHITTPPFRGGLTCLFPMPFLREASIRFVNTGTTDAAIYYYVDWEQHEAVPAPVLPFHATLHEEHTRPPEGVDPPTHGTTDYSALNPATEENYVFLDVDGCEGHYVGTGLSIHCTPGGTGKWWEGDDMFVIDGEPWPPRLHGTGTEDYFNLAWGFRRVDCRPEHGITFLERGAGDTDQIDGRFSMYRFHLNDPIPFERSIRATIEHGHANDCEASYRSVAFWYGRPV